MTKSLSESLQGHTALEWTYDFLTALGAPCSQINVQILFEWMNEESGGGGGMFNPLNTVQPFPGATNYNSVGVKNYLTYADGIAATVMVITDGQYDGIVSALKAGNSVIQLITGITTSIWGTKTIPSIKLPIGVEMQIIPSPHAPLLPGRTPAVIWNPLVPLQLRLENGARMKGDLASGPDGGVHIVKIVLPAGFAVIGIGPRIHKSGTQIGTPDGTGIVVFDDHQNTYDYYWMT